MLQAQHHALMVDQENYFCLSIKSELFFNLFEKFSAIEQTDGIASIAICDETYDIGSASSLHAVLT